MVRAIMSCCAVSYFAGGGFYCEIVVAAMLAKGRSVSLHSTEPRLCPGSVEKHPALLACCDGFVVTLRRYLSDGIVLRTFCSNLHSMWGGFGSFFLFLFFPSIFIYFILYIFYPFFSSLFSLYFLSYDVFSLFLLPPFPLSFWGG